MRFFNFLPLLRNRRQFIVKPKSAVVEGLISTCKIAIIIQCEHLSKLNQSQVIIRFINKSDLELHSLTIRIAISEGFELLYSGMKQGSNQKNFKIYTLKPNSESIFNFQIRNLDKKLLAKLTLELESLRALYGKPEIKTDFDLEFDNVLART